MALRIRQFETTCHVPARFESKAELVDRLARGRLAHDLSQHLGPSLSRQTAIVRIRRLRFRVIIPASELNEEGLSLAWKQAFGKALFTALAYPSGAGPFEVFRAESAASFIASAIQDVLDGTASAKWQYAEFESFFRRGSTQAALALICEWPQQSLAVLLDLAQRGVLDRALARFDEMEMERLFALMASAAHPGSEPLSIADLIAVSRLALGHPPQKAAGFRSRAYALGLFVEARRMSRPMPSPRAVFHSLLALAVLLNEEFFWPGIPLRDSQAKRLPEQVKAILESDAIAILERLRQSRPTDTGDARGPKKGRAGSSPQLDELHVLLMDLRAELQVPAPPAGHAEARWIWSEWSGLFFLTGTLLRLGWIPAWRQLAEFQTGGVACLAAGLALAVIGEFDPSPMALDPGVALFAGYISDPDITHLRRVFQAFPRQVRLSVLQSALPGEALDNADKDWQSIFDLLAAKLMREFAGQIRGFRQARRSTVRSFLARPGRIRIEPDQVVVFPGPSPFNVALHISGVDQPIHELSWLGGRRLVFELGDM
jgi:hypothetical protein